MAVQHGTPAAKPQGGDSRSTKIEDHAGLIHAAIECQSDFTLEELRTMLAGLGVSTSIAALWWFFARHGITWPVPTWRTAPRQRAARLLEDHYLRRGTPPHGMVAPMVLDGAINRDAFHAYVEQVLVPELNSANVLVLDNLSSHKAPAVREMIEAVGASLLRRLMQAIATRLGL